MKQQAISLTKPLDFREVVDFRQLRNLLVVAVCCKSESEAPIKAPNPSQEMI